MYAKLDEMEAIQKQIASLYEERDKLDGRIDQLHRKYEKLRNETRCKRNQGCQFWDGHIGACVV